MVERYKILLTVAVLATLAYYVLEMKLAKHSLTKTYFGESFQKGADNSSQMLLQISKTNYSHLNLPDAEELKKEKDEEENIATEKTMNDEEEEEKREAKEEEVKQKESKEEEEKQKEAKEEVTYAPILPKEEKVTNLISILANLTRIPKEEGIMNTVKNALLAVPDAPSLPEDIVKNYQESLLSTVVPPQAKITYEKSWHGYTLPVFTGMQYGRLGNVMCHYSTMYALNKIYNASMLLMPEMRNQLKYFPNLTLPNLPVPYDGSQWVPLLYHGNIFSINYASYQLASAGLLGPHPFVTQGYPVEIQLFHIFKEDLRKEFTFSNDIKTKVQTVLKSIKDTRKKAGFAEVVFVGFHVRLTDYVKHIKNFGGQLPGDLYYHRAMNYYREKFPNSAVFILATDEQGTLIERFRNISDVFFAPGTSAELDMAMLNSCNHSIITVGSYGFFSGFLTEGEVVYPDITYNIEYSFSRKRYERMGLQSFVPLKVD